jgi:beta-xylosidase
MYRKQFQKLLFMMLLLISSIPVLISQEPGNENISNVWVPDNGDGTYKNPVIFADYSDPDVIRVGNNFYMTASSFNCVPGLPILQSFDLVNWKIIGAVFTQQKPLEVFNKPQHGNGVWAPAIRYHNNEFYIYYGDPDRGIYMTKTSNAAGPWTDPFLIKETRGWIDPCPLWDDDGNTYLIHAWAGSRAGIKSILTINRMNVEGTQVMNEGVLIFDGHKNHPTVEGPKIYKRNGYYYIMAPAGGVKSGWQLVLLSKNIYGPYDEKIVLHQGNSSINGPHQGAWIETQTGESWFIHFQDLEAYGRVVHLQPVNWIDKWPIIGIDINNDSIGEPVLKFKKPNVGKTYPFSTPQASDEFNTQELGLQWQWHANPQSNWGFPSSMGFFRLNAIQLSDSTINLWEAPNLLLQKFIAPEFTVSAKISFDARSDGEITGLIIMGTDYSYIAVRKIKGSLYVCQTECKNAEKRSLEVQSDSVIINTGKFILRIKVSNGAVCNFLYSEDGNNFKAIGEPFIAKAGYWIGAKVGMFCMRKGDTNDAGYADFDWFRIE